MQSLTQPAPQQCPAGSAQHSWLFPEDPGVHAQQSAPCSRSGFCLITLNSPRKAVLGLVCGQDHVQGADCSGKGEWLWEGKGGDLPRAGFIHLPVEPQLCQRQVAVGGELISLWQGCVHHPSSVGGQGCALSQLCVPSLQTSTWPGSPNPTDPKG